VFTTTDAEIFSPSENFIDYEAQSFPVNSICWAGHINYGADFAKHSLCQGHLGSITTDNVNNSRKEGMYAPIQSLTFNVKS
jgi:hypothetical protein